MVEVEWKYKFREEKKWCKISIKENFVPVFVK